MIDCGSEVAIARLLADCRDAMTAPRPEMAHWGPYCRLIDIKLATPLSEETRRLVDAFVMRMRAQLAPFVHSQLAGWRLARQGEAPSLRLLPNEPLAADLSAFLNRNGEPAVLYHGTVRGLLIPIHLRGLRPEFRPDRSPRSATPGCALVADWREAEVDAVLAHLRGPTRRALAYWQPAVLRLPVDGAACERDAVGAEALPVADAQVWLIGEDPRPHFQPLAEVLSARRSSLRHRPAAIRQRLSSHDVAQTSPAADPGATPSPDRVA